ncbi:Sensor histidine kinase RcsC [Emticicia aquatica]|uniref:histidine kinase n=1 Tax=Emticicia aquatica TaxID=1681835 RepID=A0ABN8EXS8_9BACT|nr:PAS domain S-box protein [Emticicia aquatica]CAH0996499.1 Sensor histidine kinase RcsC [Emticicia aquatica]
MTQKKVPFPFNEKERLNALLNYNVLDTFSEDEFDDITKLASYICQVPIALISLIDEKRQWFKSRIGLDITETPRNISFCQHAIMDNGIFEVVDALENETFQNTPLVTEKPNVRFYAGVPLTTPEGYNIGTLCVMDNVPKGLNDEQKQALSTLAKHVIMQLELRKKNFELKNEVESLSQKALETITLELNSYKLALDETSSVVITDKEGVINFVNDTTCSITKYSREELIGQNNRIFNSGLHPKEFFTDLWKTVLSGEVWKNEVRNKAKDGTFYWADTTIVPFLDEKRNPLKYVVIKRDITKQKQEETKINQFFNLSLDYLCVANTSGYFETISPTFARELGFTNEELKGNPFFEFIHEEDVAKTKNEIAKLAQGFTSINFETRFKCKNGDFKLLNWNASPDQETKLLYAIARDITISKKINEENKRLSLVAKGTDNIVVITDKDRKIEWVNQPFETLTGYTLEEVIGKRPSRLLQYEETDRNTIAQIREALNNNVSFKGEIKNRSKYGKTYWLEINISPIFNDTDELINFIAIESDITEKKKKDLNIANLIATQTAIFNGVGHAVIFTDLNGIIKRINKAGLNMIEYSAEEVVGKMTPAAFHDIDEVVRRSKVLSLELGYEIEPGFESFVAKTRGANNVDSNEWTYITKSGRRIPVWLSVTCIKNPEGTILGFLGVAEDYTIKKQAELELINAKNLAEQAVFAKDSFLANMSHEIRTPLNAIIGFTEILAQSNLDKLQSEFLSNIQVAGDNLLLIVNDILDLSKIECGQLEIESHPFNLRSTLKHVYDLLRVKAEKNNLEFNLFLDANMPEYVNGDKGRINQIIMNLAGNAIKFTEDGEVTISVKKTAETADYYTLKFSVKDTGIGIPEDKLETIFDRFTQAEISTTRKFGGTGLGLSIVKQLVELQNGQIQVKSKIGRGSEFYFSLDFKKVDSAIVEMIRENHTNRKSMGKLSILLCEDNILNQKLARNVIEKFGFDLDIANNGQEGIDLLLKNEYDLILMDLQMPVKDGYQTTISIRKELKLDIPIIAMTAHSLVGEQQKCFDIGMNGYVAKPFKQQELLDRIQTVMDSRPKDYLFNDNLSTRNVDFSYLDELSGGNVDFRDEMIDLFVHKIPNDLDLLEQLVDDENYANIKRLTHDMKPSLSMFQLTKEVNYLEQLENSAKNQSISAEVKKKFGAFKQELLDIIDLFEDKNY